MKTIQSFVIHVGFFVVLLVLGAAGATGQVLHTDLFAGTFTLPFEAQWGDVTLPAGHYAMRYGIRSIGIRLVEVVGKEKGSPYRVVLAGPVGDISATENTIVCIRKGNKGFVRELRMGAIGESLDFAIPHGVRVRAKIVADKGNHSTNTQLAQAPMRIQRIPVKPNVN